MGHQGLYRPAHDRGHGTARQLNDRAVRRNTAFSSSRCDARISEIVGQTRFACAAELESTLRNYLMVDNHNIPQRALNHLTPIQALKEWQQKKPELFVKRVYNQAGLDTYWLDEVLSRMQIIESPLLRP